MIFSENIPIFVQIAERLSDEILAGNYAEGERVPSVMEYSVLLEVNVNTTVKAYDLLSSRGVLLMKRGMGYYVSEGAAQHILEERRGELLQKKIPELVKQMQLLRVKVADVAEAMRQCGAE